MMMDQKKCGPSHSFDLIMHLLTYSFSYFSNEFYLNCLLSKKVYLSFNLSFKSISFEQLGLKIPKIIFNWHL
jgi:hypothetical protein